MIIGYRNAASSLPTLVLAALQKLNIHGVYHLWQARTRTNNDPLGDSSSKPDDAQQRVDSLSCEGLTAAMDSALKQMGDATEAEVYVTVAF